MDWIIAGAYQQAVRVLALVALVAGIIGGLIVLLIVELN